MMRRLFLFTIILTVLFSTANAQDIPKIEVGTPFKYTFQTDGEQLFAQFNGKAGDVVTLTAEYDGFVIGTLNLDIRDTVGRSVGLSNDYGFKKFILAELPTDGLYSVVVTSEKAADAIVYVNRTGELNADGVSATITSDSPPVIFSVKPETEGDYVLTFKRTKGDFSTSFALEAVGQFLNDTLIHVEGSSASEWTAKIHMSPDEKYFAFLDRSIISSGKNGADVEVTLMAAS